METKHTIWIIVILILLIGALYYVSGQESFRENVYDVQKITNKIKSINSGSNKKEEKKEEKEEEKKEGIEEEETVEAFLHNPDEPKTVQIMKSKAINLSKDNETDCVRLMFEKDVQEATINFISRLKEMDMRIISNERVLVKLKRDELDLIVTDQKGQTRVSEVFTHDGKKSIYLLEITLDKILFNHREVYAYQVYPISAIEIYSSQMASIHLRQSKPFYV